MSTVEIIAPHPATLEAIKASLAFSEELKKNRGRTPGNQAFLDAFTGMAEQAMEATLPAPKPFHPGWVNVCRIISAALPLTTDRERQEGMPLWRWAALANLRFRPAPVSRPLYVENGVSFHAATMPKRDGSGLGFVPGKEPSRYGVLAYAVGGNTPLHTRQPIGAKILDQFGSVLAAVGVCSLKETDTASKFTLGIAEAPPIPEDWIFRQNGRSERRITHLGRMALENKNSI